MKKIILILFLALPILAHAQGTPEGMIKTFFTKYESQSPGEALDYIFSTNQWMEGAKTGIDDLKYKLNSTIDLIGNYYSHNLITTKSVGDDLKLFTYIVKYDRQPLRFTFIFYKPADVWQLQNFKFDDDLTSELEVSATLDRLSENMN